MKRVTLLPHAQQRMRERDISIKIIQLAISSPIQIVHKGRFTIFHRIYHDRRTNKNYMLRVFTEEKTVEIVVRSVYRTSKIAKYWRS